MILPTIYKYLEITGTMNNVYTRAKAWANPEELGAYYLTIWEEKSLRTITDNGEVGIRIACHVPPDNEDDLDKYIVNELFTLLDNKTLVDGTHNIKLSVTNDISETSHNDDGTMSRNRLITLASRWR